VKNLSKGEQRAEMGKPKQGFMLFLNFISCLLAAACSTDVEWGRVYIPQWTRRHALIFVYRTIRTTPQQTIEL
jgi:hypothetical protein